MSAIQFVVLILIGVVCANVSAIRQLNEVSKETKFGISDPKTAKTNGLGDQLRVRVSTSAYHSAYTFASASNGPNRPRVTADAGTSGDTSGTVVADGPIADAFSRSRASGSATSTAAASRHGAAARGVARGDAGTVAGGHTRPG